MKSIDELDYYELLEVPRTADAAEIERAYRLAQQTYAEGSLALYSVFESLDAAAIRQRLDEAFAVLADAERRSVYDRESAPAGTPFGAGPGDDADSRSEGVAGLPPVGRSSRSSCEARSFDGLDEAGGDPPLFEDEETGEFDGIRLRRARLFRGYEIDHISEVTKVSGIHLRNIEDENFGDLPADVYVRGFVTAYARTIGLDPQVVVPSYMTRVREFRSEGSRARLIGRR
ncbi:MAG: helix-turn-helix domain-containing protein [bacterium]